MRVILIIALLSGCSDAERAKFNAWGRPAKITCYSGSAKIYDGESTGAIETVKQSDGWEFREKGSEDLIRVSGACLIRSPK